jgi:hypothetical protein
MGRFVTSALVASVAVSAIVGPLSVAIDRGDLNGDGVVDILDAQVMIAQVMNATLPLNVADVTGDGRIDVLDLQFVMARLNDADSGTTKLPDESSAPKSVPASLARCWAKPALTVIALVRPDEDEAQESARFDHCPVVTLTPDKERYLFTLTPNAPPFLG